VEQLLGDEAGRRREGLTEGELRPDDLALKPARDERDNLARRIDMERAAIRDALGSERPAPAASATTSGTIWNRRYLPRWCRLFESRLEPGPRAGLAPCRR
jgi:hypothetical protein